MFNSLTDNLLNVTIDIVCLLKLVNINHSAPIITINTKYRKLPIADEDGNLTSGMMGYYSNDYIALNHQYGRIY